MIERFMVIFLVLGAFFGWCAFGLMVIDSFKESLTAKKELKNARKDKKVKNDKR